MSNISSYRKPKHFLGLLCFTFLLGCGGADREQTSQKLYIVATTGMIADAVANIVQDSAVVEGLMGPGVDPHLYKATRSDLTKLREADIIFYNGLHLEGKMGDIMGKLASQKPVFAVSDGIPEDRLITLTGDTHDPHIWFDVSLWKDAVAYIGQQMAVTDSSHATFYRKNTTDYTQQLDELHQQTKAEIATIPKEGRVLITAHDAFNYFGKAYNIEVKGLQGISTVSEFGLKDVSNLVSFISDRKIKAVFVESSVPTRSLEAVVSGVRERGQDVKIGGTLYSDAMGEAGTDAGTYLGMVRANVNTITSSLK